VLALLALLTTAPALESSVVKVQVYSARYDWKSPWRIEPSGGGTGTGFLIEGGRIVTNAHVIRDARQVLIKRHHQANPYLARIEAVANDCDLALLRVDDPDFHAGLAPLPIGALPEPRSVVTTYGYPAGGQELSSTTGIVSRIEWITYVHTNADSHIAIQTDAAINPGNSGGPVIQDGKVVGVAFQGLPHLQNVGYFIPSTILQHVLDDLKDGRYDGYPDTGANVAPLLSPAYRKERGLRPSDNGVVVEAIEPHGSLDGVVAVGDVLLALDGVGIANDASVPLGSVRGPFHHLLDMKQIGDKFRLSVLRGGKQLEVEATARRMMHFDRVRNAYFTAPKYLIYSGLVFMLLDREYLKTYGNAWPGTIPRELAWHFFFRSAEEPDTAEDDVVVLTSVLRHPVNAQLTVTRGVLERVDGAAVKSLADVDLAIAAARQKKQRHLKLEYDDGFIDMLDLAASDEAHPQILESYKVPNEKRL